MREYITYRHKGFTNLQHKTLPNVHLGVSVENQEWANKRIPELLRTDAAVRYVSMEPQLEHVDLESFLPRLDGVIQGCESGLGRREFDVEWARSMRAQCARHDVPYFLKQIQIDGKVITEPMLDGVQHLALPGKSRG